MTDAEIYAKLNPIFRDVFDADDLVIKPEMTAKDVDGWDSLSHVRLGLTVERAFGVRFSAADITGLKNVGELVALVRAKTGG